MKEFVIRRELDVGCQTASTRSEANECARSLADDCYLSGNVGLYGLIRTFGRKPETVSHDIDALIGEREKSHKINGGNGVAIACGVLRQLKKMGVTHLDLPEKIEA